LKTLIADVECKEEVVADVVFKNLKDWEHDLQAKGRILVVAVGKDMNNKKNI
jgi:hypothetical protein